MYPFPRRVYQAGLGLASLLLVLCAVVATAFAQQAGEGTIRGEVTDPTGALVRHAKITLRATAASPLTTTSGDYGEFLFNGVSAGEYSLKVEAQGFREDQRNVTLGPSQQLTLAIRLSIQVQRQRVSVSDDELNSSPEHNLGAVILRGSDLDALPTDSRDLMQRLQIMSGSDVASQFFVDGFTVDHLPPKSSILEIRMNQDPFAAAYDAPGNGRIEIVTKPGSDKLQGSLEMVGEDSSLNSQNPYVAAQSPYASFYFQGSVSGALTKASSGFLSAAEESIGSQSFVHAATSSTGSAYTQTVDSPQFEYEIAPRVDFQVGKIQTFSLRYDLDRELQDNLLQSPFSLPIQAVDTRHTEHTIQWSDTQTFGPRALNVVRLQWIRLDNSTTSRNGSTSILVQGAFNGGGNNLGRLSDHQYQYEVQDDASLLFGKHLLHLGGRLRDIDDNNSSTGGFNGEFIFSSIQAYETTQQGIADGLSPAEIRAIGGGASQFSITAGTPNISVNLADLGLYIEDEWKPTENMTLTPGFRFETQNHIHDRADFAPRLSYGWAIGAKGSKPALAVFRAGTGLFYQRFTSDLVLNAARQNGVLDQQYVVQDPDFYPNLPSPGELGPATLPTIYQIGPRVHAPSLLRTTVGLERQISKRFFLHADYTWERGIDQLLTRNINAPLPGTYNPADPGSGTRPLGTLQNIYEYQSEGASRRDELYVNARFTTKPVTIYGYYLLGKRKSDTQGAASFPSNQYDLHADYGRASNDIRNRLYLGSILNLPLQFELDPFAIIQSNAPFNITVGQDLNGDSQFNDRPAFATDLSRPSVYHTRWGNFDANPIPGQTIIPMNYGVGPSTVMLDMTLSRTTSFGPALEKPGASKVAPGSAAKAKAKDPVARRYQLNFGLEAQNVFNQTNGGLPVGVLGSPIFGQSTSLTSTQFTTPQANRILYLHMVLTF